MLEMWLSQRRKNMTAHQLTQSNNHPAKGSMITVDPIRGLKDIAKIKDLLADNPRDLAIFILGINTNLRASDIVRITVGQIRGLQPGDALFCLKEKKTQKNRRITINQSVHDAVVRLLATMPDAKDSDWLFQSRKGGGCLTVPSLNRMVKSWCAAIGLKGNFGSHSLRKTFSYQQLTHFKTPLHVVMTMLNHSSIAQTLAYAGIQPEDISTAYMNNI
jgi:integrase